MSDQTAPRAPQLHDYPRLISQESGVPGVIVLARHADGTIHFAGYGINNAQANEMLSVGIYVNLNQHYRNVEAGLAGEEAQRRAAELNRINERGV